MITTMTNLRATATEAYEKGYADGKSVSARNAFGLDRALGRREGGQAVRAYALEELRAKYAEVSKALEDASTRWEKRLLTGRLDGLAAAIKIVTFAA